MPGPSSFHPRHAIRIVLSPAALLPLVTVRNASLLAVAQLGFGAFFFPGIAQSLAGDWAGWVAIGAVALTAAARAVDLESWALLLPGGALGRVGQAFGPRVAAVASSALLVERLLFAALAAIVIGHYSSGVVATAIAGFRFTGYVRPEDLATLIGVGLIGLLWLRSRTNLPELSLDTVARVAGIGIAVVSITTVWALVSVAVQSSRLPEVLLSPPPRLDVTGFQPVDALVTVLVVIAITFPSIGAGSTLAHVARELPPPRVPALRRTALLSVAYVLLATTIPSFLLMATVPSSELPLWFNAPLAGIAQHVYASGFVKGLLSIALALAAVLVLAPAAQDAFRDAEGAALRAMPDAPLFQTISALNTRLGVRPATDATVVAVISIVLLSAGRLSWLTRAYGLAVAANLLLTTAALVRLRAREGELLPFKFPLNPRLFGRERPVGLVVFGSIVAASVAAMIATGDLPTIAAAALIATVAMWSHVVTRPPTTDAPADGAAFDLLPAADLSLDQVAVRPGSVLVPVRNRHALGHVVAAIQAPADRDVVVMTARLIDIDVSEETARESAPTPYERQLFSDVITVAERHGRAIRLLIVPARDVSQAIVSTALRLRASDIYIGESVTLSAAEQARLLGNAWERAERPDPLDVRVVIHHRTGRADSFHLGVHTPSLNSGDLDRIHRLWLDAVRSVGPHVHHHDVVRAALIQMEEQLSGPQRDVGLAAIREVARPAEELAGVVRQRDYARLRDMLRNRDASELADLLAALNLDDQVIVFRVLPRKDAAAVFGYLTLTDQEHLLKGMGQEDIAELLNNMAPDDRTLFLEELPAEATRQLLALLTPAQRSVAVKLLGYPEKSVGRLMTPHYVAVRESWAVHEVLDYVRTHGQDSETLNVLYVVDDHGRLIDDVRIREVLLAPLDKAVAELMDRRFVALKATDDQASAVSIFRQHDRTALPVTDSVGVLIGIVTIDDVLDVAEAATTREIQRIGGTEALDEPYMDVAFGSMIRKRAGWLTALFLGEMLTATAMGAFEAEISRAVILALFVPLIISSGGNSGSQASTLVIRALALGEVALSDWWKVMRRELLAGLALGAILGGIGFLRITLWSAFSDIYGPHWLLVALTVSTALVGVVLWGTLSGSLLPFVLKRLGFDPAASSAPFVATLVDVTGLVIYFSVALVVLRGTLL